MEFPTFFYLVSLLLVIAIHNSEGVTESEAFTEFFNTATSYMKNKQNCAELEETNDRYKNGTLSAADFAQILLQKTEEKQLTYSMTLLMAIGKLVGNIDKSGSNDIWCSFSSDGKGSTCSFLKQLFTNLAVKNDDIVATFRNQQC